MEMTDGARIGHLFHVIAAWFCALMVLLTVFTALPHVVRIWATEARQKRRLAGDPLRARGKRTAWAGALLHRFSREATIAFLIALGLAVLAGLDLIFSNAVAHRPPYAKYLLEFAIAPTGWGWALFFRVTSLREWVDDKEAERDAS